MAVQVDRTTVLRPPPDCAMFLGKLLPEIFNTSSLLLEGSQSFAFLLPLSSSVEFSEMCDIFH